MASVDLWTADHTDDVFDEQVIDGDVDVSGHLILTTRGGTPIDAGNVVGPAGADGVPLDAWPVGSIFMAAVSTSPATLLGGGTWVRFGEGRMPISQDSGQTEFDTAEETGGAKTHTLTSAEMPSHKHDKLFVGAAELDWVSSTKGGTSTASISGAVGSDISTGLTGGGAAHNNMPPYIVVYMWKRTA
jgi:hypothetical protein